MKKILKIGAGVGLVLVGIVGLILPVLPGWALIIPGLIILAEYFPAVRRLLDWAKHKLEDVKTRTGGHRTRGPNGEVEFSANRGPADSQTGPIRDR
jgi:hypothetical protein